MTERDDHAHPLSDALSALNLLGETTSEDEATSITRALEEYQEREQIRIALGVSTANSSQLRSSVVPPPVPLAEHLPGDMLLEEDPSSSSDEQEPQVDGEEGEGEEGENTEAGGGSVAADLPVEEDVLFKLPEHVRCVLFTYVDEDSWVRCQCLNQSWHHLIARSEGLWKMFCDLTFRAPIYKPIQVLRNGKPRRHRSWVKMGLCRPRVRYPGLYMLRQSYFRDPGPRTMWSVGYERFHRVEHFKYLWFMPNGKVLYSITPTKPNLIRKRMRAIMLARYHNLNDAHEVIDPHHGRPLDEVLEIADQSRHGRFRRRQPASTVNTVAEHGIYEGSFQIRDGGELTVVVSLSRHTTKMKMELLSSVPGRNDKLYLTMLQSVHHSSQIRTSNTFREDDDREFVYVP